MKMPRDRFLIPAVFYGVLCVFPAIDLCYAIFGEEPSPFHAILNAGIIVAFITAGTILYRRPMSGEQLEIASMTARSVIAFLITLVAILAFTLLLLATIR